MKKILIAMALLPFSVLTACAVYPDGYDYSDRYEHRGNYDRHDHRGNYEQRKYDQRRYDRYERRGDYDNRDDHRGRGYFCPPGQEKKGRC
ncbi:hypothetical protein RFH42_01315 [Acinetobacter rudis]|nr:hypothetical protein [Acinetobacter rudis]MDQ8951602.1 hypothetical protein [Acinetobacter rudis]